MAPSKPPSMRLRITELPILPSPAEAPITATARGCMMRVMAARMSSRLGRGRAGAGAKSSSTRTSTAVAPAGVANTGFKSSSAIAGWSSTSCPTLQIRSTKASLSTPGWPRTPSRMAVPAISSNMAAACSRVVGASRKVTSRSTSTSTPPKPNATSLPKVGSVTAPTITSCAAASCFCTSTPSTRASGWRPLAAAMMSSKARATPARSDTLATTPPASVLCRMSGETTFATTG